jgi:hemolysin activation/secretion protein
MPLQNRANVRRFIETGALTQISACYEEERSVMRVMLLPDFRLQRLRWAPVRQFSLVMLAGCIALPRSYAQVVGTMPLPPAELVQEGLRRQEQRNLEQQQHLQPKTDILRADTVKAKSFDLPVEEPCFKINKITVGDGAETRFAALADVAKPFLNHCIGVQGLHKVAAVLNARLVEQGYVTTSVSFPAQNLSLGTLAFKLHTGRVAAIELVQAGAAERSRDTGWGSWKNAFPLEVGDVLNIRALEQGVEQMTRLRSQEVTTRIEPGQEADSSIVYIERNQATFADRLYGSVTLDNSGSETLGRPQLSGNVTLDNLAGVNDVFTISGNINAHRPTREHRSYSLAVSYNIPWDYHTFNLSQNSNHFAQFVQGTTARFLSSGSSSTSEAKWSYLAWRTGSTKAGVYGTVSMRRARSYLDDVELVVQRRRTTTLELGATLKQFAGQGVVDLALGYRRGMGWGGAQEDFTDAETGGPTLRPRILSLTGGFSHPFKLFGQAFKYSGSVRAQATRDTTLSIDQISIGGYGSVRGFDGDSVLLAESGLVLRNEVSHALPAWAGLSSNAFVALDAGVVRGASADRLVGKRLAGIAVGTRGRWKNLMFEVSIATPVHKPSKFRTCSVNPYVSVTYAP